MKKKETFYIETLGCKVNQYESDGIAASLEDKGLIRGKKNTDTDICIINTCAVTSKAGMQSRQAVRRLIREHPNARVIVTGCHAQTDPELIKEIDNIDHIVCHKDKGKIADCIHPSLSQIQKAPFKFSAPDHGPDNQFFTFEKPVTGSMTRAYLKIQDGCNAFCTYCIVPYARGGSVSMPPSQVYHHMEGLAAKGFKEVIITGIHTGMYGLDLNPSTTLAALVKEMDQNKGVERIRISSIEPGEINQDLIDLASPSHILCDHFHIPLQSGDDDILKRMKRPYTAAQFESVIHSIHQCLPYAGIGLDILMGFPGETDEQFQNSYDLIKKLPVSYLHVFPFSARKGTPAFHFDDKVPTDVIKKRCAVMRELDQEKRLAFIRSNQGRTLQGLVQNQEDKKTGMLKAVTSNYLTVCLEKDERLKGRIVDLIYDHYDSNLNIIGKVKG